MSVPPELRPLMRDVVTVTTGGPARDQYGTPSWSTATPGDDHRARVVRQRTQRRDTLTGETISQEAIVWLDSTTTVSTGQRVTLPDGEILPILQSDSYPDERGNTHQRLTLGYRGARRG